MVGAARRLQTKSVEAARASAWSAIQNTRTLLIETFPSVHVPSTATPAAVTAWERCLFAFLKPTSGDLNRRLADQQFDVRPAKNC
jgi:hypothetical protein